MLHYDYEPLSVPDVRVEEVVYSGFLRAARAMRVKWKKQNKKTISFKDSKNLHSAMDTVQSGLCYFNTTNNPFL